MLIGKIITKLPALIVAGGIWFLSSQSTLPVPKGILGYDKLQHFIAYFALAVAVGFWVSPAFRRTRRFLALLLVTLIVSLYGAVDEIHQSFTPVRDCSVWDWIADTLGALSGAAVMIWVGTGCLRKIKARSGVVV
jgi:VanZ family protein